MSMALNVHADPVFDAAGPLLGDYLAVDWSSTPLGPVADWPASLRAALTICLASRFPMALMWGPDLVFLYNDVYRPMTGGKHPASLGTPCSQVVPEIWPIVGPMMAGVMAGGPATYSEDQLLLVDRHGFLEECYFTFSYSPIPDGRGGVDGILTAVAETTGPLFAARRVELTQRLGNDLTAAATAGVDAVLTVALRVLRSYRSDLTTTAIYLCDEGGRWTRHGSDELLDPAHAPPAAPEDLAGGDPRVQVMSTPQGRVALVRIAVGPCNQGLLACHLDPQVPEDSHLLAFITQIGRLIGGAVSTAAGWSAERARVTAERAHHQQLLHRERHVAEVLQRSLLPVLPPLAELDVAARYSPGDSNVQIGGDWYDAIDLGAGRTALVIGDVMGRGIAAAAIMGQLRAAVRAYAQLDLPPDEVLTLLDLMIDQLWDTSFVTCLYGVYDPADRSLTFANAGHFSPLLIAGDPRGVTTMDVPPDPPLGSGVALYQSHRSTVPPGSVLALFTDGLVESRLHDIDDGLTALNELLDAHADETLEVLADLVLVGMRGHHQHDDDTALLLLRTPVCNAAAVPSRTDGPRLLTWIVQPGEEAVHHGRAQIRASQHQWGLSQDTLEAAQLVISELITNALRYGHAPVHVQLRATPTTLYIEVADASPYRPRRRAAASTDENGRGLLLVTAYSRRWGVRPRSTGKVVWAELDLNQRGLGQPLPP